jgi:colicin import membrane protein
MSIDYHSLNGSMLEDGGDDPRLMSMTFLASVMLHALIATAFLLLPGHVSRTESMPSVIDVSMVSLSDMGGPPPGTESDAPVAAAAAEVAEPEQVPLVTAETVDVTTDEIPVADEIPLVEETAAPPVETTPPPPEPEEKVFVKEAPSEPPPPKPVKRILPRPETEKPKTVAKAVVKPEANREESIKEAIQRVRKKIAGSQRRQEGAASGSSGSGSGLGRRGGIDDIYKAQLSYQIERNWVFSDQLAGGDKHLKSVVVIRIQPTGHIQDIWFEQRSGNAYLDDSAYKAVMKSNPLPPLPKGYPEYTIALVFTPSGLR